jgi:hypothetical protein
MKTGKMVKENVRILEMTFVKYPEKISENNINTDPAGDMAHGRRLVECSTNKTIV